MSRPIHIWHHCKVSGGDPPISFPWAIQILSEQIIAMRESGLAEAATEITFGVNGDEGDTAAVASIAPTRAKVIQHPPDARGELPTLWTMWHWARAHPGWAMLYLHIKGATHTNNAMYQNWRRCMESVVIHQWRDCVRALNDAFEAAGNHWLTARRFQNVGPPFFGGNFFWVTSDFWATIPEPPKTALDRPMFYLSEVMISSGARPPRVRDFGTHWPGAACAQFV